jgi:hypothetical protein
MAFGYYVYRAFLLGSKERNIMKKTILIGAVFSLFLISFLILFLNTNDSRPDLLHFKQKGKDFERVNLREYKEYVYANGGYVPLTIIWWQEMTYPLPSVDRPFKKFCVTSELRTIMKELDALSQNKKTKSIMPAQDENNTLRIYLTSGSQKQFLILEIKFALDPNSHEFVSEYGRSAKLYESLSSKEESENYWGSRRSKFFDSNEYKQHWRDSMERMRNSDPNG